MAEPRTFGRYRVTGTLGAGAMGQVYAAIDEVLGREVAVKTLRATASGLAARIADERFKQEARAIASLTHPSVVQVFDIDLAADPPYLVMERVAGPSLKDRLASPPPLSEPELRALGIQIANALAAAHARGVVHRDVKPANILAAGEGTWKLADFGVAHVPDSSLTMTGQFVGSPAYAPPEALVRGQLGPASDVFGLGATLYQAAAGMWPRAEATTGGLLAPTPPLRELAPAIPVALASAIDRALAIEPDQRPTAAELAAALAGGVSLHPGATGAALDRKAGPEIGGTATATGSPAASSVVAVATPLARASTYRWKHIVAGVATILVIVLIAISRRAPSGPPNALVVPMGADRPAPPDPQARPAPPDTIHVVAPPISDGKAARAWNKLVDKLRRGELAEARRKLAEWEHQYGETAETRALASQLDALPEPPRRGRDDDER